ncbi:flagellar biosynthesis repressor FlbT [Pseudoroseomonas rhizosphaerae]|uniref:Flagellar biosynthesis repressor FlbT n=1 Tax=Teichococcus rhizosphaerae TaxID=1335062 RepID=A0A2C7AFC7_9PROT|nr:flagellar biosynthesis repressor FlbT [Pseudoroseomonas rhizosphaerae]PHK96155.1 flagellar biosynthesis repressor FlbT [Pseudoroseomonas rhizosphaerae]
MSTLVLELRQGDLLVVNGAPLRFRNRARVELTSRARFLFGKQIMTPEAATTPARRIYFALQAAYIGNDEERERGLELARDLVAEFQGATTSGLVRELLESALALAQQDECYQALKLVRRVMQHEDAVLRDAEPAIPSRPPSPPGEGAGAVA